jgi:predicted SAM-dependent methyltransferase
MNSLLNIGCGTVFHPDWLNFDLVSTSPNVKTWDIRRGFKLEDTSIHACYSSHFLEHLSTYEAKHVLSECFRVLQHQGILRIVVPDLETVARDYLKSLEELNWEDTQTLMNHEWMTIELIDQMVRDRPAGKMGDYLKSGHNREFVRERLGTEADRFWERVDQPQPFWQRMRSKPLDEWGYVFRNEITLVFARLLLGENAAQGIREGLFRNRGEVHRWMYDRISLTKLLHEIGFIQIQVCLAEVSQISDFETYELDIYNGRIRRPHSLYIEARKP